MTHTRLSGFSKFAILSIPFVWLYEASVVGPTLGALSQSFPGTPMLKIQLIMVLPFVSSIIFSVVSGKLAERHDKKPIVIFGLLLYATTGVLPAFAASVNQILVLRFLTGVGVGLVLPLPNAIIAEHFLGEQRERMLGLATSVCNIANIVASIVIGFVLLLGWRYPFYSFGLVFVIAVVALMGLPQSLPQAKSDAAHPRESLPMGVWYLALFMAINFMFFAFNILNCAIFMTAEGYAPYLIGICISLPATGSAFAGAIFPEIARLMKGYIIAMNCFLFAIGFALLYGAHSLVTIIVGNILIGIGSGALVPYVLYMTAIKVKPEQKDLAFGIVTSCIHVGFLLSPFVQLAIAKLSNNDSQRFLFLFTAVVIILLGSVSVGFRKRLEVQPDVSY